MGGLRAPHRSFARGGPVMTSEMKFERAEHERGFTMVELMVVIGIVGVLIAVMIPTLLQARRPAQDRQAQNLLRNSLTAAKAIETSEGAVPTAAALGAEESAVVYVDSG